MSQTKKETCAFPNISQIFAKKMEKRNDKKKLYLTQYEIDKYGGSIRIQEFFDYNIEIIVIPNSYIDKESNE